MQIGSGPTTLSGTGALAFAVNDGLLSDNVGSFTVTVSYACWPGWGYGDVENHTHRGPPGLEKKDESSSNANGNGQGNAGAQADQPQGNGKSGKGKG